MPNMGCSAIQEEEEDEEVITTVIGTKRPRQKLVHITALLYFNCGRVAEKETVTVTSGASYSLHQCVSEFKGVFAFHGKVLLFQACGTSVVTQQRSQVT
jgi:hypothetical protein